jgi:hypothetical protein
MAPEQVLVRESSCAPEVPPIVRVLTVTLVPALGSSVTVYVPFVVMHTSSLEVGTVPLLQLDAVSQLPPAVFVQVSVHPAAFAEE